jgi:hypothetical protein
MYQKCYFLAGIQDFFILDQLEAQVILGKIRQFFDELQQSEIRMQEKTVDVRGQIVHLMGNLDIFSSDDKRKDHVEKLLQLAADEDESHTVRSIAILNAGLIGSYSSHSQFRQNLVDRLGDIEAKNDLIRDAIEESRRLLARP